MKKYYLCALLTLLAVGFFLRFYKLPQNPPGLYWDEVSIGYNAYSILKTGKDEHGQTLPIFFKAFGEYKSPVYIYATSFSTALFGPSEFAVRFPSALAGVLTILAFYLLMKELFSSHRLGFLSAFLLTISPWHLHFSRAGFEANVALFFLVLATYFFLRSRKQNRLLILSALLFSLTLFTYSPYRLFVPLFILILNYLYRPKFSFIFIFLIFYLLPILSPHSLTRFPLVSAFDQSPPWDWPKILGNNYLSYFSFDFLFFQGDQISRHGMTKLGNLYFWEIPVLLVGLYQMAKTRHFKTKTLLFSWLLAAPLSASLTDPSPHSLRSFMMIVPLVVFSALGLDQILFWFKASLKGKLTRILAKSFLGLTIFYFFLNYLHHYWVHYPKTSGLAWQEGNKKMVQEILKLEQNYDQIYISDFLRQTYVYLLFYGKIDPDWYRLSQTPDGFDKYHFVLGNWPEKPKGKTLFILSFDDKLKAEGKLLKEIKISNGDSIYRFWEMK